MNAAFCIPTFILVVDVNDSYLFMWAIHMLQTSI